MLNFLLKRFPHSAKSLICSSLMLLLSCNVLLGDFIRNWSLWCHSLCSCCIFTYFWAQNIFVFIFFHFQQGNLVVMSYLESLSESISLTCAGRAPFLHSICIIAEILTVWERLSDHFKNYFWMHFVHVRSFYYGNLNI